MPTNTYDCHQAWLVNEKCRMAMTGFITPAENLLLRIFASTSEYYSVLLNVSTCKPKCTATCATHEPRQQQQDLRHTATPDTPQLAPTQLVDED